MRISTSQIFSQSLNQLNSSLNDVTQLTMMNASQKRINSPSDDPAGMGRVMELSSYESSLSGYLENCATADEYLGLADEVLMQASEIITAVMELAEQGATETFTETQLEMMALEMEGYLDSLYAIANTDQGTDAIFAGNDIESDAYAVGLGVTLPEGSLSNAGFTSLQGETDTTIRVRFDSDGEIGADAVDYSYSTDNGETWTSATLAAGDTVLDLGTVQADMLAGTDVAASEDDAFMVRRAMVYTGSDEALSVAVSEGSSVEMNTVGSTIFGGVDAATGQAYEEPNLFETISDCIVYLETGDYDGVAECLENIRTAHEHVETGAANIGAREDKVTYIEQSLSLVKEITTNSISREEDADAAQLIIELEQANYVYEAVLSTSSDIMKMTLLNYI
ncbi:flagellin N-terminal helical domain-containing protein [Pseudodesulfovibrio portus]|uniref:Flagellin N-terminal domain-containing protein n=1 Tax=Pseudodesulfovibrio portus TaxID=231439 RepID=A0ABN6RWU3_9BACT|nr:flagellin [Pseudodesulfovibrio portus]BDQ35505.1 hypothetical protein JCM14722_30470 [Pseudodesulfovibrio portus]